MKTSAKLLITLSAVALVSACTTTPVDNDTTTVTHYTQTQTMVPQTYACEDGNITIDYTNSSVTRLDATIAKVGLNNQRINLYREVSGSGALYVDRLHPDSTISWHTKGNEALFAVDWKNGTHYQTLCNRTQ